MMPEYHFNNSISGNTTYSTRKNVGTDIKVKNLNVRKEKIKQMRRKKLKARLQKITAVGLAVITASTITAAAINVSKKINKPDGFDYTGSKFSASQTINDNRINNNDSDFIIVGLNNREKGINKKTDGNITYCVENSIPYGVEVDSTANSIIEAKADAYSVMACVDSDSISCPVYYNVDTIADLSDELFCEVTKTFINELDQNGYNPAIAISEENLGKLDKNLDSCDKLVRCYDKEIEYNGYYNTCFFKKTGDYYSNLNFSKAEKLVENNKIRKGEKTLSKGIDVSQHQGNINWESVKKDGVEFAILRFSGFYGYHSTGNLRVDEKFYENVVECQRLGIPYGIYCYTTAETEAEAKDEAKELLRVVQALGLNPDLKIYYDIEMQKHFNNPTLSVKLYKTFKNAIEKAGFECGIYASYSLLKDMVYKDPSLKEDSKWVARYLYDSKDKQNRPGFNDITEDYMRDMHNEIGNYDTVQVTQYGVVKGINDNTVDVDYMTMSEFEDEIDVNYKTF